MSQKSKLMITVLVVGAMLVGFVAGSQVQANPFAPGSMEDPLVSKSYMDEQLQLKVHELEAELARVRNQANELQAIVNDMIK